MVYRVATEAVDLAIFAVIGERGIELGDAREGGAESGVGLRGAAGVKLDADQSAHVGLDGFEALRRGAAQEGGGEEAESEEAMARRVQG